MSNWLSKALQFKTLTIAKRFIIVFSIVIALFSIFIYLYFPAKLKKQAEDYKFEKAKSIAEMTAFSVSSALYFHDIENINESLKAALQNKDVVCISILDTVGHVVSNFNTDKANSYCFYNTKNQTLLDIDRMLYIVNKTIIFNGTKIGKLIISFSLKSLWEEIMRIRLTIALISLLVFIIGIIIVAVISSFIVLPLKRMAKTFDAIAEGDITKRVNIESGGEIKLLVLSFNRMADNLQLAHKQLSEINKHLEDRVSQRTIALQNEIKERKKAENEIKELNKVLEYKVNERTADLERTLNRLQLEIYEKTRAQQALIAAKEEVTRALTKEKELNELKSRFISMVSHEYRTPLTVIMTSTYLLEKYFSLGNHNRFEEQIKKIQISVTEMTALLENILFIGKSDAGKVDYNPQKFDLIEFCKSILHEVQLLDDYKHVFEFRYFQSNIIVTTDQKYLRHIISNLLSNAAKYSQIGETVKLEIEKNDKSIIIKIEDYGIGISSSDLEHIYEPFFRADSVSKISGTGLGLSIVRYCSDLINAEISVDSKISEGTTFCVKLPMN